MKEITIKAHSLDKQFEDVHAVNDVSFEIQQGEIFSLLGPNGAGKTTTIGMISGLLTPDAGEVWLLGHSVSSEPKKAKAALGVFPHEIALYEDISGRANLNFWGKMYGLRGNALSKRVDEVLALIGLEDPANGLVSKYSGGMKRRFNVSVALLHEPEILIMDEPTVGIDLRRLQPEAS
jgi:ABC-2 type transport system ATP-binding protein